MLAVSIINYCTCILILAHKFTVVILNRPQHYDAVEYPINHRALPPPTVNFRTRSWLQAWASKLTIISRSYSTKPVHPSWANNYYETLHKNRTYSLSTNMLDLTAAYYWSFSYPTDVYTSSYDFVSWSWFALRSVHPWLCPFHLQWQYDLPNGPLLQPLCLRTMAYSTTTRKLKVTLQCHNLSNQWSFDIRKDTRSLETISVRTSSHSTIPQHINFIVYLVSCILTTHTMQNKLVCSVQFVKVAI